LEGQRRAMEQFQQVVPGLELDQRRHGRMAESGVGVGDHPFHGAGRKLVADEGQDHRFRDAGIGGGGEPPDARRIELRPGLRHVEAPVAGKASEDGVGEAERGCLPARRNKAHPEEIIPKSCGTVVKAPAESKRGIRLDSSWRWWGAAGRTTVLVVRREAEDRASNHWRRSPRVLRGLAFGFIPQDEQRHRYIRTQAAGAGSSGTGLSLARNCWRLTHSPSMMMVVRAKPNQVMA